MHLKYQRGYINPSTRKPKKESLVSIRLPSDDRELLDEYLERMNTNKSAWGRSLVMKELEMIKASSVSHSTGVHQRYTSPTLYTQRTGVVGLVISFFDFLQTQKKPEFGPQASIAQHRQGH